MLMCGGLLEDPLKASVFALTYPKTLIFYDGPEIKPYENPNNSQPPITPCNLILIVKAAACDRYGTLIESL